MAAMMMLCTEISCGPKLDGEASSPTFDAYRQPSPSSGFFQ